MDLLILTIIDKSLWIYNSILVHYCSCNWYISIFSSIKETYRTPYKNPIKTHNGPWGGNNTLVQNVNQSAKNMCSGHYIILKDCSREANSNLSISLRDGENFDDKNSAYNTYFCKKVHIFAKIHLSSTFVEVIVALLSSKKILQNHISQELLKIHRITNSFS